MEPPLDLDRQIRSFVKNELNPSIKNVFLKLMAIQIVIGSITMLFCPQFSLSLTNSYELFHYFHRNFGENFCMMICGFIFLGSGAIVSSYILGETELLLIRKSKLLFSTALSILALSFFLLIGAEVYLQISLYWALGAVLGFEIITSANYQIRLMIQQRSFL